MERPWPRISNHCRPQVSIILTQLAILHTVAPWNPWRHSFSHQPPNDPYHTDDIIVYNITGAEIPIVHRVMETRDVFIPLDNSTQNPIINSRLVYPVYSVKLSYPRPRLAKFSLPPGKYRLIFTKSDNNHLNSTRALNGSTEAMSSAKFVGMSLFCVKLTRHSSNSLTLRP